MAINARAFCSLKTCRFEPRASTEKEKARDLVVLFAKSGQTEREYGERKFLGRSNFNSQRSMICIYTWRILVLRFPSRDAISARKNT